MITYKNLTLIGTSHIAIESIKEVEGVIREVKPNIVALELDRGRFRALMSKEKSKVKLTDMFRIGIKGYLFGKIGAYVEKKLGNIVGVSPGDEMKKAAYSAREVGAHIAFIDQDIGITLKRFSKEITWKEKFRFLEDLIVTMIKRPKIKIDLNRVPDKEVINKLMGHLKKRYPNIYKVLVDERNKFMAKNLYILMRENNVVAVIGAGHEEELIGEIKCLEKKNLLQS